jgi:hypothetical protein
MGRVLITAALVLLLAEMFSCSNGNNTSGPASGSGGTATAADIFATIYTNNAPGTVIGGTATLDGGSPVAIQYLSAGRTVADFKLYSKISNGSHTLAYSDSVGTTLSCTVDLNGAASVNGMSLCYSFNNSGALITSAATCGYKIYYSCP